MPLPLPCGEGSTGHVPKTQTASPSRTSAADCASHRVTAFFNPTESGEVPCFTAVFCFEVVKFSLISDKLNGPFS